MGVLGYKEGLYTEDKFLRTGLHDFVWEEGLRRGIEDKDFRDQIQVRRYDINTDKKEVDKDIERLYNYKYVNILFGTFFSCSSFIRSL